MKIFGNDDEQWSVLFSTKNSRGWLVNTRMPLRIGWDDLESSIMIDIRYQYWQ